MTEQTMYDEMMAEMARSVRAGLPRTQDQLMIEDRDPLMGIDPEYSDTRVWLSEEHADRINKRAFLPGEGLPLLYNDMMRNNTEYQIERMQLHFDEAKGLQAPTAESFIAALDAFCEESVGEGIVGGMDRQLIARAFMMQRTLGRLAREWRAPQALRDGLYAIERKYKLGLASYDLMSARVESDHPECPNYFMLLMAERVPVGENGNRQLTHEKEREIRAEATQRFIALFREKLPNEEIPVTFFGLGLAQEAVEAARNERVHPLQRTVLTGLKKGYIEDKACTLVAELARSYPFVKDEELTERRERGDTRILPHNLSALNAASDELRAMRGRGEGRG